MVKIFKSDAKSVKLYFKLIGMSVRSQMEYRASFIMMALGHFLVTFIEFIGIWVLFDRFGSLEGWKIAEVALLYGVINSSFAISEAFARGFDVFARLVKMGEFDRMLLRPRTTVLQILGHDFQLMRMGRLTQGLFILIWAAVVLDICWSLVKIILLIAMLVGGTLLFSGLMVLQATLSFWSVESLEIVNSFTYGGVEMAQFPISIYKKWFQRFFLYVIPLGCINYLPLHAILERTDPLGSAVWLQWVSPAAGVLFFIISLFIWKVGVRHYCSTGS